MNDIIIFSLFMVTFLRILGVGIAMDFYHRSRENRFLILAIGWMVWVIGGMLPLFSSFVPFPFLSQLLQVYNVLMTTLALITLCYVFLTSLLNVNSKIFIIYAGLVVLMGNLFYFTYNFSLTIFSISLLQQIMWIYVILLPSFKWKKIHHKVDSRILFNYYVVAVVAIIYIPIVIIIYLQGFRFGLYESDDILLIMVNYGYLIIFTIILNILALHLQYRFSQRDKIDLKDKYSHNLGNALQAIYTSLELLDTKTLNSEDQTSIRKTLREKQTEAVQLLREIRDL
jgi:hypothetical protein